MYVCIYIYIYYILIYIRIFRESNHDEKKATCLKNILNSRLCEFILFTFYLKPLHKTFLQLF